MREKGERRIGIEEGSGERKVNSLIKVTTDNAP